MKSLTSIKLALSLAIIFFLSGCAWQNIPPSPQYTSEKPIPLKVGIIAEGPYPVAVIEEWKEMHLFKEITYPYREGDPVNMILNLSVLGSWSGSGTGAGIITGLTFGLAGTVIGPSLTGYHDAKLVVTKKKKELERYSSHFDTEVEWGLFADSNIVSQKADALLVKKIAADFASKIRTDRPLLVKSAK